jgi:putative endonuclease
MYHVYLLRSRKNESFYIGYTNNIQRRLSEHNDGTVEYTKKYKTWQLIYCESFISLNDAKIREKSLKHFGKAFSLLKSRIKYSLTEHCE